MPARSMGAINLARFRNTLLYVSAVLLVSIIFVTGWLNHFDFERSIINAELRELLVIAKSASHDIENGALRIKQEPEYIDKLIQRINDEETFSTFVINDKHIILSDPVKRHIGKDILEVGKEALNVKELSELNAFVGKIDSHDSGTATLFFPTKDEKPKKELKLVAFAHSRGQDGLYAVIVTETLSALTSSLHRNARDTLVLMGLFFLVLLAFGYMYYRTQKKRFEMEVASRALEIINKQLRCDINDYKCVEKSPKKHKG
jgi:hypothetical protein